MSAELVTYIQPSQSEWGQLKEMAEVVSRTPFVPEGLRGKPNDVLAALLTGRELGIGPMQSLRDVYIVNGRPSLAATLMVSRVRAAGHRFRTLESTADRATVQIHRCGEDEPEPPVTFTTDDAKAANLAGKPIWKQYPKAMHWSRAASAACRRDASECLSGVVYTPEEVEAIPAGEAGVSVAWGEPVIAEESEPLARVSGEGTQPAARTTTPTRESGDQVAPASATTLVPEGVTDIEAADYLAGHPMFKGYFAKATTPDELVEMMHGLEGAMRRQAVVTLRRSEIAQPKAEVTPIRAGDSAQKALDPEPA